MKIRKLLIIFSTIFIVSMSTLVVKSASGIAMSYTQGVYNISELTDYTANAKLISKNKTVSVVILDKEGDVAFFKKFDTIGETVNLGIIKEGYMLSIIGDGEVAIIPT